MDGTGTQSAEAPPSRRQSASRARAARTTQPGTRSAARICMATKKGGACPSGAGPRDDQNGGLAVNADLDNGGVIVPISGGEVILRGEKREISILLARKEVTITHARYSAGEQVAGPHVHHEHTDAFYVLEGELTFEIGREAETITVSSGGFVAAPPQVAHSFRNDSDRPARWLTIHAHDGGFAAFMRGARDGMEVQWDISAVPARGGLPASEAIVSPDVDGAGWESGHRLCSLKCALPDLCVVEWH